MDCRRCTQGGGGASRRKEGSRGTGTRPRRGRRGYGKGRGRGDNKRRKRRRPCLVSTNFRNLLSLPIVVRMAPLLRQHCAHATRLVLPCCRLCCVCLPIMRSKSTSSNGSSGEDFLSLRTCVLPFSTPPVASAWPRARCLTRHRRRKRWAGRTLKSRRLRYRSAGDTSSPLRPCRAAECRKPAGKLSSPARDTPHKSSNQSWREDNLDALSK